MRAYRYVGPEDLRTGRGTGQVIRLPADFDTWTAGQTTHELAEPFTFVVDLDGMLRLAPRRSEHVACADGEKVLSAGEIAFDGRTVTHISNQSTGYCPDVISWPAVEAALDRAGLAHPAGFTHEVVFRRCPTCQERNIVRESYFVCVFCDGDLPGEWNVDLR